ncbi:MAG: glycosyltransferase family 4 protein [Candidatus Accumulibacter phosphatis]|jgi:glycosyltransferase involved in cell wall biosynthesis|nr:MULTISPECIES: glycosyltransferase family 4 protein [Candidatus Accumulibacter]MBL8406667.1 glycosyltransferase family 4 protein [Accumulibacter sp.]NMQ06963.1 glycosyltransferase family 4 protein [Candidatus Accumulibacter contiguus]HRF11525.1 glycosyltransferase family 4 protein [Candidatus Accumulibacter phosphatis]
MASDTRQVLDIDGRWPAICVVGPLPPPSGGMAGQCDQLVRLLRAEGLDVALVRTNSPYRPEWIGRLPVVRAGFRLLPYLLHLWQAAGRAGVMHVLANSGWAWHLIAAPAIWIAHLRNTPVIINYRGGYADKFLAHAPRHVLRMLAKVSLRVTPSAFLQRVFSRYGLTAEVIPNIIDLSRFAPVPQRSFGDAPHLVVTRNLEPWYDMPTAIRAFARILPTFPRARLTVAGSGPELFRLQALVAELGLQERVRFSGRIENSDIPALYATADCLLNPSTVDNMPISILEAFASGVPVVSTCAGGIPDMIEQGVSGLLVPIGDHEAMARELLRVLQDASLAAGLRQAGLRQAERFAWTRVRAQWLDTYRRVAGERRES